MLRITLGAFLISLLLVNIGNHLGAAHSLQSSQAANIDWRRMCPVNEEFCVLVPVQPSLIELAGGLTFTKNGETLLAQRSYSGYFDDFAFSIESYTARNPTRLFNELSAPFKKLPMIEENVLNGVTQRRYLRQQPESVWEVQTFTTAKHIYVVTVGARQSDHPGFSRFFSGFTLRSTQSDGGDLTPKTEDQSLSALPAHMIIFKPKDLDQRVVVVWKPDPAYTEEARRAVTTGTVVLIAVLTESGRVAVVEIVKPLKRGLTERAIEAAKNIKFLPGKINGSPVSVRFQLEYNFNLY